MFFRKRRPTPKKVDPMHVIGFLQDFIKPSFTLSIGGTAYQFSSAWDALSAIEARKGSPVFINLGEPASLTRPSEARYVGVEIPHEQYDVLENSKRPPSMWIRSRYSWYALWRFKLTLAHEIADETEQFLAERFNALRLNRWVPVPELGNDVHWIHWLNERSVMPWDFEDEEPAEDTSGLMSATAAPKQRSWAIEPIAQRKKTTLISGDPGIGKSQIALDLAMRVTRGIGLPNHPAPPAPAGVMICENEDDWDEDVIPRLIAVGANRKLIRGFFASDLHTREGVVRLDKAKRKFEAKTKTAVGALILSPYMACFGGGSTQESHMRQKLFEIERWQKDVDVAIIGVAHLGGTGDVAGPKTFKRAARGSWKVVVDETDPERNIKKKRRLLIADKVNNAADDFQMAYRIRGVTLKDSGISTSKIVWEDTSSLPSVIECDDGITAPVTMRDKAKDYLRSRLENGPVSSKTVLDEMRALGFSMSAVYAAKDSLRIMNGIKGKTSEWFLP